MVYAFKDHHVFIMQTFLLLQQYHLSGVWFTQIAISALEKTTNNLYVIGGLLVFSAHSSPAWCLFLALVMLNRCLLKRAVKPVGCWVSAPHSADNLVPGLKL